MIVSRGTDPVVLSQWTTPVPGSLDWTGSWDTNPHLSACITSKTHLSNEPHSPKTLPLVPTHPVGGTGVHVAAGVDVSIHQPHESVQGALECVQLWRCQVLREDPCPCQSPRRLAPTRSGPEESRVMVVAEEEAFKQEKPRVRHRR